MKLCVWIVLFLLWAGPVRGGQLYLVEFTASWCGSCQKMKKEVWPDLKVQDALRPYKWQVTDYDSNVQYSEKFGIKSVPTLVILDVEKGKSRELARSEGFIGRDKLVEFLNKHKR